MKAISNSKLTNRILEAWLIDIAICALSVYSLDTIFPDLGNGKCCNRTAAATCQNGLACRAKPECNCNLPDVDFGLSGIPWGMRLFASSISASPSGRYAVAFYL